MACPMPGNLPTAPTRIGPMPTPIHHQLRPGPVGGAAAVSAAAAAWLDSGHGRAFGHNSVQFYEVCIRPADGYGFVASLAGLPDASDFGN